MAEEVVKHVPLIGEIISSTLKIIKAHYKGKFVINAIGESLLGHYNSIKECESTVNKQALKVYLNNLNHLHLLIKKHGESYIITDSNINEIQALWSVLALDYSKIFLHYAHENKLHNDDQESYDIAIKLKPGQCQWVRQPGNVQCKNPITKVKYCWLHPD
jgi:hypothetical protein